MLLGVTKAALDEISRTTDNDDSMTFVRDQILLQVAHLSQDIESLTLKSMNLVLNKRIESLWNFPQGQDGLNVLRNYYGEDYQSRMAPCNSGDDLLNLIAFTIDSDQELKNQESDGSEQIQAIASRPGHQFRLTVPKTRLFRDYMREMRSDRDQSTPGQIAEKAGFQHNQILVYGDSNHGTGDSRTLYGLRYRKDPNDRCGSFHPIRLSGVQSEDTNFGGNFEILTKT